MSEQRLQTGPEWLQAATTTRRRLLTAGAAAAALAVSGTLPGVHRAAASAGPGPGGYPFRLGVASGDPLPEAVVIWTRLVVDPLAPFGGMDSRPVPVRWEVAEDESFRRVVHRGTVLARPELSHSVHVDVVGLRPWRHYWYRFRQGRHLSPVGRTRTAPALGSQVGALSLAFASCQYWSEGFYTAYADMAAQDHDVVLHLGDYIYEYGVGADSGVRGQQVPADFVREAVTLDEYRGRYALYKSDPDLQAAHAAAPWIVTLDDHEVQNNWAGPVSATNAPQQEFLIRRANAFRAYWENMPLRLAQSPAGPDMQLYRRFQYGNLLRLNVLDTRQYRSDQAAGDGGRPPNPEAADPARTLTGAAQERWLLDGFAERSATWDVLAQQVLMAQFDVRSGPDVVVPMDTWDGYTASRDRVLRGAQAAGVRNLVSLAGDAHRSLAADLKLDFSDPDAPVVGSEFLGTSITSGRDGSDQDPTGRVLLEAPHVKYHNAQRGYVRCTVTPQQWLSDFRVLDRVTVQGGTTSTRARLAVADGVPGVRTV